MKPILFVAYGGGHVAMLAPVYGALRDAGHAVAFLALTTAGPYLDRLGIAHLGFRDFPDANSAPVQAFGQRLAAEIPLHGPVAREETIAYLGQNFADLVQVHGPAGAQDLYARAGRQSFLPVPSMLRFLQSLRPSMVVATNSPRSERAAIAAAGQLGIPAVCVVDMFALQEVQWIGQPGYADRVCVLNETVRQMFLAHGRRPDEVVLTGNPAFDRLNDPLCQQAGVAMAQARGWRDGRVNVLWASQVEPARHPFSGKPGDSSLPQRVEDQLRALVAATPELRLIVRYHPSEQRPFVPAPRVVFSALDEDLGALLHAVDVVVVLTSTVGVEAWLAGRPVLAVEGSVFTDDAPLGRMGIATAVAHVDDLAASLLGQARRVVAGKHVPCARSSPRDPVGGSATQAVVRVVQSLLT